MPAITVFVVYRIDPRTAANTEVARCATIEAAKQVIEVLLANDLSTAGYVWRALNIR